jgi:hypothetical protein
LVHPAQSNVVAPNRSSLDHNRPPIRSDFFHPNARVARIYPYSRRADPPKTHLLKFYEARVAKRFLLDDDEGGLRPLAPRLDSNSKQDQQTDKYEESDRIQVDQGCGKLPDEQDQIDLTDHWNERQEPPRE